MVEKETITKDDVGTIKIGPDGAIKIGPDDKSLAIPQSLADLTKPEEGDNIEGLETQNFVDSLRLLQFASPAVGDKLGSPGQFLLANDKNLGEEVSIFVCAQQWHAMKLEGKKIIAQSWVCVQENIKDPFDKGKMIKAITGDEIFKEIANSRDDNAKQLVNLWGKDVLIFINELGVYGNLFLSRPTSRKRFKEFNALIGKPAKLGSKLVAPSSSTFRWYEPRCSPVENISDFVPPTKESLLAALERFAPPKVTETSEDDR
jgi:hypothetical protein